MYLLEGVNYSNLCYFVDYEHFDCASWFYFIHGVVFGGVGPRLRLRS